jgi:dihydrofolate synthase/folylpolyglutamate synthase
MLPTKDGEAFFKAFTARATAAWTVPIPDSTHHAPDLLAQWARAAGLRAAPAVSVPAALHAIAAETGPAPVVLIAGSLHLAGAVLAEAGLVPA